MNKEAKSWLAYAAVSVLVIIAGIVSVLAYNSVTQSVGDDSLSVNFNLVTEPLAGRAYTPQCLADCHLTYCVTPSGNSFTSPVAATEQDISYVLNQATGSDSFQEIGIDFLATETYLEDVDVNGTCQSYRINEETGENESYSFDCVTDTIQEQRTRPAWKRLTSSSYPELEAEKEQCFDIWAKVHPSLSNPLSVDVIPTVTLSDKTFSFSEAAWWNSNWSRKKAINITGGSAILNNFTVYVPITNEGEMQSDYDDIRFLNGSEDTEMDFELDWYNSSAAGFWIRFPVLQTGNNTIYLYYGNDNASSGKDVSNTWDDGIIEVYHFNNGSNDVYNVLNTSCYIDKSGTWTTRTENVWNFGNTSVFINGDDNTAYGTFTNCVDHPTVKHDFTITFWADLQAADADTFASLYEWSQGWTTYVFQKWEDQKTFRVRNVESTGYTATTDLSTFGTGWQQYVGAVNNTGNAFYHNGTVVSTAGTGTYSEAGSEKYLMRYHNQDGAKGYLTELRYDLEARNDSWIQREWQNKNSSYVWFGSETSLSPYAPESQGDNAIINGIALSTINTSYTTYTDRRIYSRNITGGQATGRFDVLVSSGNQRWTFNYISSDENTSNFTRMVNITPSFYVWEAINLTSSQITSQVTAFINSTKQ